MSPHAQEPTARLTEEEISKELSQFFSGAPSAPQAQTPTTKRLSEEDLLKDLEGLYPKRPSALQSFAGQGLEVLSAAPGLGRIATEKLGGLLGTSQEAPFFSALESGLRGAAQQVYPEEIRGRGNLLTEDLPGVAGGIVGSAPGLALGPVGATLQFGAMEGVPMYYQVKEATGDEEAATWGLLFGGAVGQLERFGAEKLLGPIVKKLVKKGITPLLERAVLDHAIRGGGSEVGSEGLQVALSDALYEALTDEEVDTIENLTRALPPALIAGGGFGTFYGALNRPGRAKTGVVDEEFTDVSEPEAEPARTVADIGPETAPGGVQPTQAPEVVPEPQPAEPVSEAAPEPVQEATPEELRAELDRVMTEGLEPDAAAIEAGPAPAILQTEEAAVPEPTPVEEPAEAVEPEPEKVTGIKNEAVERELEKMGLPLPEKAERKSEVERHAEAKAVLEKNPDAGKSLLDELESSPRPPSDSESALLTFEANRLIVAREAADQAYIDDPSEANQQRVDEAVAAYQRAADILDRAGTESGRSLNARKMMLARDYSLAAMERKFQVSKGGEPLTVKERARVRELHAELETLTKEFDEYVTASELKQAELEAEKVTLKLEREAKRPARQKKRAQEIETTKKELDDILNRIGARASRAASVFGALDPELVALTAKAAAKAIKLGAKSFAQWSDSMISRFGEAIRPYLRAAWESGSRERRVERAQTLAERIKKGEPIEKQTRLVNEIARGFVDEGVVGREELVGKVHEVLQEVIPGITRRQTMDAISGYGVFRELTKDETSKKLRALKGELRELGKLDDLAKGLRPKKSGFEREEESGELRRLKKRVRDQAKKLGINLKDPAKELESKLQARRTRLERDILDLEGRIERKEFAPRVKAPLPLDEKAIELAAKREETKLRFEKEREAERRKNRSRKERAWDGVKETLGLVRTIWSSFDWSAVFRQGFFFTFGHPIQSAKNIWRMSRAFASEKHAQKLLTGVRNRPGAKFGEASGLEITDPDGAVSRVEEIFRSNLAEKIPLLGRIVRASNRAYTTYLNLQRAINFDLMVAAHPEGPSLEVGKELAFLANAATGRGPAGKFAQHLDTASTVLWAPRLYLSRLQLLAGIPLIKGKNTRKLIAKEYARTAAGLLAFYTLAKLGIAGLGDDEAEVELDPRSSDFGKIRVGNVRVDPLGGISQFAVLGARIAPFVGGFKPLGDDEIRETKLEDVGRFLRTKLNPVWSTAVDIRFGEDVFGREVTPLSGALKAVTPLSMRDVYEELTELGLARGAALSALSLFGMGVQIHQEREKKKR